jgi:hypothetical protein
MENKGRMIRKTEYFKTVLKPGILEKATDEIISLMANTELPERVFADFVESICAIYWTIAIDSQRAMNAILKLTSAYINARTNRWFKDDLIPCKRRYKLEIKSRLYEISSELFKKVNRENRE